MNMKSFWLHLLYSHFYYWDAVVVAVKNLVALVTDAGILTINRLISLHGRLEQYQKIMMQLSNTINQQVLMMYYKSQIEEFVKMGQKLLFVQVLNSVMQLVN
ncbi:MAG: hypothetical protein ACLRWM_05565 [Streptococcus sp.]